MAFEISAPGTSGSNNKSWTFFETLANLVGIQFTLGHIWNQMKFLALQESVSFVKIVSIFCINTMLKIRKFWDRERVDFSFVKSFIWNEWIELKSHCWCLVVRIMHLHTTRSEPSVDHINFLSLLWWFHISQCHFKLGSIYRCHNPGVKWIFCLFNNADYIKGLNRSQWKMKLRF